MVQIVLPACPSGWAPPETFQGLSGFPSKREAINAGRAIHLLLNREEVRSPPLPQPVPPAPPSQRTRCHPASLARNLPCVGSHPSKMWTGRGECGSGRFRGGGKLPLEGHRLRCAGALSAAVLSRSVPTLPYRRDAFGCAQLSWQEDIPLPSERSSCLNGSGSRICTSGDSI